jgi:formamidopyrimidine-DNA glycosylase
MPELPEVETVVRALDKKLKGQKITLVEVLTPKLVAVGSESLPPKRTTHSSVVTTFKKQLEGHKVESVKRRAKLLLFNLSGPFTLLVHLKMTGQFIYEDLALRKKTKGEYRLLNKANAPLVKLPGKHTHVVIHFANGGTLYFNDVRKFAYLKLVPDDKISEVKELAEYGPEPLEKDFTLRYFTEALLKKKNMPIKLALMENKLVVGIGNIYSDEILFHAHVKPIRKVGSLGLTEVRDIYNQIGPVLKKGIEAKGSSVGDFIRPDGSWGSMGKFHFVYGRKKQPCKRCGTLIQSIKLGGRTSSFCPKCQN